MNTRPLRATLLLLALFAFQPLKAAAPTARQRVDVPDVAVRWEHFLATAELSDVLDAYGALPAVAYDGNAVDADRCRDNARTLSNAIERVPVSVALRRAAYLCAQALDDASASDRALAELVALSRYALAGSGEFDMSLPVRVVAPVDAQALVRSSGFEELYAYYPMRWPERYFPLVIAVRDGDTDVERHLVFDYIDTQFQIARKDDFSGFPYERIVLTRTYIDNDDGILDSLDRKALNDAMDGPPEKRIATLRAAAERGGTESAKVWLAECSASRDPHCADGLVDALLPMAEKQYAYPTVLLAVAYMEGIGIGKDPKAAWALLDSANRHWRLGCAYERFARLWQNLHRDEPLPAELDARLAQAAKDGNRYRERSRIVAKIDAKVTLTQDELAFLADARENWWGFGAAMLAEYEDQQGHPQERRKWLAQAAEAGDADSQASFGFDYWDGKHGEVLDRQQGRRLLQQGAQSGAMWAGRYLGWEAMWDGRWREAEGWLLAPALEGDELAALNLADLFAKEPPGVTGKLSNAIDMYRELDARGSAAGRRRLADLAINGRGMPKDPAQARAWLLQDAEKNDPDSIVRLAWGYANGDFGPADMKEAMRWMERALATGDTSARDEYGRLLYLRVATHEAHARAFAAWQESADKDDDEGRNELAWALCTSADPQELDPLRGLAIAKAMGDPGTLQSAFLDTLAACHAAAGEYERGAVLQQQVLEKVERQTAGLAAAEREPRLKAFRERLDLYRAGKPYRVPVPAPAPAAQSDASKPNSSVSLTSSPTK